MSATVDVYSMDELKELLRNADDNTVFTVSVSADDDKKADKRRSNEKAKGNNKEANRYKAYADRVFPEKK